MKKDQSRLDQAKSETFMLQSRINAMQMILDEAEKNGSDDE